MVAQLAELRLTALTAIASDDWLMERLVLKGGCALELVHRIGGRSSLDIDFSIEGAFTDLPAAAARLEKALVTRFTLAGYRVFDFRFEEKPEGSAARRWGGYTAQFKLIEESKERGLKGDLEASRRNAVPTGPNQRRIFRIEISKHEHCPDKQLKTVEDFDIYVYSPAMIVAEKIRAICQQSPQYLLRRHQVPRARDFYDIHAVVKQERVALRDHEQLLKAMFEAKEVPLRLLSTIAESRGFHETSWPMVRDSVSGTIHEFDFYFDFVLEIVGQLEPLWDV